MDFTEEDLDRIIEMWDRYKEDFEYWTEMHGFQHLESWCMENDTGHFDKDFLHYIIKQFFQWKVAEIKEVYFTKDVQ